MYASELKKLLDTARIRIILEGIGCEKIKQNEDYISATRGNGGDNPQGVICYLQTLNCLMPTTAEFEKFHVQDIITVVQCVKKISFPIAVKFICDTCGIEYYLNREPVKNSALVWLDAVETGQVNKSNIPIKVISENVLKQFIPYPHKKWMLEGITPSACERFGVGYDIDSDSITIPVRDELGNLVGVKCRSVNPLNDNKYWYLYATNKSKLLFGEFESLKAIEREGFVIVVEAEKSVIKGHSFGIENIVAVGGKKLSDAQIEKLLRMNKAVVLALDHDVTNEEIEAIAGQLKFPLQTIQIYALQDKFGLYLKGTDSPADNKDFLKSYKEFITLI